MFLEVIWSYAEIEAHISTIQQDIGVWKYWDFIWLRSLSLSSVVTAMNTRIEKKTYRDDLHINYFERMNSLKNKFAYQIFFFVTLAQRPLVRLARELQRLSSCFHRCTRHDVTSGLRVLFSASLFASATRACVKAITLAKLEGTSLKKSKQTLAGLQVKQAREWGTG